MYSILFVSVSWAPTTVLKLMGSYLVFVVAGFILVLFCLEAQPASSTHSSFSASAAEAEAADTTEHHVQKAQQLKVRKTPSLRIGS